MRNTRRAHFITFLIGTLLIFIGIGTTSYGNRIGDYLIYIGFGLYGIFWIWSIFILVNAPDLKPFQKRFWLIAMVTVPVLAGLLFHFLHNKPGKITT